MSHTTKILSSFLASTIRQWRGTMVSDETRHLEEPLQLFEREGCPWSRLVREALSELNLDADIYPVPIGGSRYRPLLNDLSGHDTIPFLYDPNSSAQLIGAQAIIDYLFLAYAGRESPNRFQISALNLSLSRLSTIVRGFAGTTCRLSKQAKDPMILYSFEASPFSRPVRELLCELELRYQLINLSKQKWSEMGTAKHRWHLGAYQPNAGSKREQFLDDYHNVQVPFLIDPNTNTALFESKAIIAYLMDHYMEYEA